MGRRREGVKQEAPCRAVVAPLQSPRLSAAYDAPGSVHQGTRQGRCPQAQPLRKDGRRPLVDIGAIDMGMLIWIATERLHVGALPKGGGHSAPEGLDLRAA